MTSSNLLTDKIPSLIWKIGLPAGIGFFFNTLFNVTDAYWAGKLGVEAATAMSQTFPIFLLLIVFGSGLSSAASTLVGNSLGAGNQKHVKTIIQHILAGCVFLGVVIAPLFIALTPWILHLTGDPAVSVQALSRDYIFPILLTGIIFLLGYTINGILNAYGDTKTYSYTLIVGAIVNFFLDPLLMYGWGPLPVMGIVGLAWATIIIQFFSVVYMAYILFKRGIMHDIVWAKWRPEWKTIKEILAMAVPASLSMVTVALGIFVINAFLKDFGTNVMAVYGVGTRIEQIVLLPTIGISVAASVIIAQNNGAKNFHRVRSAYYLSLLWGSLVVTPLIILIWIFSDQLFGLFITDPSPSVQAEVLQLGRQYVRVVTGLFWGYIFLFITTNALQSVKKPMFGLWIGIARQIVLPIIVFTLVVNNGGNYLSVWWSIFGIVWASAIVALIYGARVFSKLER